MMKRRSLLGAIALTAASVPISGCQFGPDEGNGSGNNETYEEPPGEIEADPEEDRSDLFEGVTTVTIDYDAYEHPSDVYYSWNVRTNSPPTFEPSPTDGAQTALAHHFDGDQKTANTQYQFVDNGFHPPKEAYSRIKFHPNGATIDESGTLRFYWAGVQGGPRSSGGSGAPTGDDGWSIALSMAHRDEHEHPDGYNFSVYTYHMDQPTNSGETERTGHQIWTDQWNEIECYQLLNTYRNGEAHNNGVFRAWVNGELAYERDNFRWVTEPGQGIERVGPVGYWYLSNQNDQTMYYDDHEITVGERYDFQRNPAIDEDSHYVDPGRVDEFENRLAYHNGNGESRYRLYVDGEIYQSDWSHATYNEDVEFDETDGYAVVDAATPPNVVDGYLYDGSIRAIDAGTDVGALWASGDLLDPETFPDEPDSS